ncbi:MAG TPA: hypothetical protein VIN11_08185, partial [Roseivirga sp.]
MRNFLLIIGIGIGLLIVVSQAKGQDARPFMYGEVETVNGDIYKGPIRWGSDEVYWVEMFNTVKTTNDFMKFLSRKQVEELNKQQG